MYVLFRFHCTLSTWYVSLYHFFFFRYLSSWANTAKPVGRNNVVSGGSDRKCKLQADDADIQLTRICKRQAHLDRRRRRAQHRQRMLANKIATHTIKMRKQFLFFVLLFHIRMIVRCNHLHKKHIIRSIAEDPAIDAYNTQV